MSGRGLRWDSLPPSMQKKLAGEMSKQMAVLKTLGPPPRKRNRVSKLEQTYVDDLLALRSAGLGALDFIGHQVLRLQIGADCRYEIDVFVTRYGAGKPECIEVKGEHEWEDSIIKLKAAATIYRMFDFYIVRKIDGRWVSKKIEPGSR